MSRLLADEFIPCIDSVKVFSDGAFKCLNDYLIDFINNHELEEGVNNIDGLFCGREDFESYSCYNFCFYNRPELSLTLFYGANLDGSLTALGEDFFYSDNLIFCYDEISCNESYLILHNNDFYDVKKFYEELDVVRAHLDELLAKRGSLAFLDGIIDELGISKVIAYDMIAEACEYFVKNNYLTK